MPVLLTLLCAAPLFAQPKPLTFLNLDSKTGALSNNVEKTTTGTDPRVIKLKGINSDARDNNPIISADGNIIFFNSTRKGDRAWATFNRANNRFDDDIYYATRSIVRTDDEVWNEPVNLGSHVNSNADDGIAAISPDGQKAFFSSLKPGWERDGGPFYVAKLRGTEWTDIQGLGDGITEFFTNRGQGLKFRMYGAALSPDGKDFYFATTVHSTTGNHQIWVSHLMDGKWGYPENLGPAINTGEMSYAPFIAADGKTLFFTSNRGEAGGDDIYVSSLLDNGTWGPAQNVGAPINTPGVDAFLSVPASGDRAYLASSREGADEDIYRTPLPELHRPTKVVLLSGTISETQSGLPLEANVVIEDMQTGKKIFDANSNSASGKYTVVLQPGHDYGISVTAAGHVFHSERYTIPENADYKEVTQDFCVEKMEQGQSIVVKNLFFAYNSDSLRDESKPELDRLANLLLQYPKAHIEVGGHTDNVGSANYNSRLSRSRAEAVKHYLTEVKGIDKARIETRGYGFDKPATTNDTDEGRQQNRRTEFTIISM